MTPIDIFEYKQRWMRTGNNHPVPYHSDWRRYAVEWCTTQLFKQQWLQKTFTDVYEDTMFFEHHQDAKNFSNYMKKIQNKG